MPESTSQNLRWLPKDLNSFCVSFIKRNHEQFGGSLPATLWDRETMVFVMMQDDLRGLIAAANASHRFVTAAGITAVVSVGLGAWLNWWIAVVALPAIVALIHFKRSESSFYTTVLALILAVEILGNDVGGSAEIFPDAAPQANAVLDRFLPNDRTRLLDIYLPRRDNLPRDFLQFLPRT